jgi:short-subunit dehydrogenase
MGSHFKDQKAVIVGASGGIGEAIALGLAKEGGQICLVGGNEEKLSVVAQRIKQLGERVSVFKADLTVDDDIKRLQINIHKELGPIDILVHCAGVISIGKIENAAVEDLDRQYRINVRAPFLLTQSFLPMLRIRRGQIVFINSSASLQAKAGTGQYAATKQALRALADCLRQEVNDDGIRVVSVYPGRTASSMQEALHKIEQKAYCPERLMQPGDVAAVVVNALKLPRTAEVTDIHIRPMVKN